MSDKGFEHIADTVEETLPPTEAYKLRLYVGSFIAAGLMRRHCRSFSGNPTRVESPDCRAATLVHKLVWASRPGWR